MRPLILAPALRAELLAFLGEHRFAAQASVSRMGAPQAAVVGIATSDELDIVFDTLADSRKAMNLRRDPRIALVVGGPDGGARALQVDGVADEPTGADRERLVDAYLRRFSDGRERQAWPGLISIRVRPTWLRFSDFAERPPRIVEIGERYGNE